MTTGFLLIAAIASLVSVSQAAIPRSTELELQKKAPEQLEIEILKRKKAFRGATFAITAKAKVVKATRSAAGLVEGAEITIKYSVPSTAIPGAPPTVVEKGKRYTAFLRKAAGDAKHFEPAAASGSFDSVGDE